MNFEFHTIESAPEGSKEILEGARKKMGFIPNLYAGFLCRITGDPEGLYRDFRDFPEHQSDPT